MNESMPRLIAPVPLASTVAALRDDRLDPEHVVETALERINALDGTIRALLPEPHRHERLIAEGRALVDRWRDPASRPPLFGALVGVKDIIAVDGQPTRAGSALPAEAFAMAEASAVTRLVEAGALVLGKTVTTEFAYFDPGATANPHDPTRTPGGSSSGSAAAVAAGYVSLALGTQTVGSVIRPAAFCGVVGFKPTFGRAPLDGVVAYSPSVDHLGWFTPDVEGARLAASVLVDGWDASAEPAGPPTIGVPGGAYLEQADRAMLDTFDATVHRLEEGGLQVRRVALLDDIAEITERHRSLTAAEFHDQHASRFARYGTLYRGISAELFDAGGRIADNERRAGLDGRAELRERLHEAMDTHGIEVWASPATTGPAPVGLRSTGDPAMSLPWTHAGVPAVTLPAGSLEDMPVGIQLTARTGDDERLLAWAANLTHLLTA